MPLGAKLGQETTQELDARSLLSLIGDVCDAILRNYPNLRRHREDVISDVVTRILQAQRTRGTGDVLDTRAYVAVCVLHALQKLGANLAREARGGDGEPSDGSAAPAQEPVARERPHHDSLADAELVRIVEDCIERLDSVDDRALVRLRYFDGLMPEQISRRVGLPPSTISPRISRAVAKVRECATRKGAQP